ncbi:hypothetical protein BBP13_13200 [Limosilactobacillus reuteri]|nr:hypothetical protein BBP13_13200 [Limosilactobacillus reuteri]
MGVWGGAHLGGSGTHDSGADNADALKFFAGHVSSLFVSWGLSCEGVANQALRTASTLVADAIGTALKTRESSAVIQAGESPEAGPLPHPKSVLSGTVPLRWSP